VLEPAFHLPVVDPDESTSICDQLCEKDSEPGFPLFVNSVDESALVQGMPSISFTNDPVLDDPLNLKVCEILSLSSNIGSLGNESI